LFSNFLVFFIIKSLKKILAQNSRNFAPCFSPVFNDILLWSGCYKKK